MTEATDITLVDIDEKPMRAALPALADNSPAAVMLAALDRGISPENVGKMMDLQERWEKREAEKAFRQAFAAFRGENVIIPKTKHVDRGRGGSFDQAEYDEICRRLSPALSLHGFGFRHDQKFGVRRVMTDGVENDVGWVWVTCHLEHRQGHSESLELEGPPGDLSVNTPTQNMQTTASYLKRQSLLAITGTATGGEDDENAMRKRTDDRDDQPRQQQQQAPQKKAYPAEGFAQNMKAWQKAVNKGKAPTEVLATVEQFTPDLALSPEQRAAILALKPEAAPAHA
jgi:hypothetical protein